MTKVKVLDRLRIIFGDNYLPISDNYKDQVTGYLDAHTLV